MSKSSSVSLPAARWWQRDPMSGLILGWALILGGVTIGIELTQTVLHSGL